MKKRSFLVKHVLMSTLTAVVFAFGFTSCADEFEPEQVAAAPETEDVTELTRAGDRKFNINEHKIIHGADEEVAAPFDKLKWYDERSIFCYVGKNLGEDGIFNADNNNKKLSGFKYVPLPWNTSATESNVPENVYQEILPKEGTSDKAHPWKLVLMQCGRENIEQGNILGFYNKYTGILRMFVYVPGDINAPGSTHMWGVLLNDKLASRSVYRYGAPNSKDITTSSAKANLKQTAEMAHVISPWKRGNFEGFGGCPLTPGWWAFDVDLSVYRDPSNQSMSDKKYTVLNEIDDLLTIKPLGKTDASMTLDSKMVADIKGDMQLEACQASTTSGIFAPFEDLVGKANAVGDLVGLAKGLASSNPLEAITNGIKLAKDACDLVGIDYGAETTGFNGYKGTMNLALNGTIDTKGIMSSQQNVAGISPITFKKNDFTLNYCETFGEGIWNLEENPVVYYTDAYVDWRFEYRKNKDGKFLSCAELDRPGPFGGRATRPNDHQHLHSMLPYRGQVTYFDPSSIKLMLNPAVFSPTEIASAKVYATCGVRKSAKFGSTESYRAAQGLRKSQYSTNGTIDYYNRPFHDAPFDALSSHKDKDKIQDDMGMKTGMHFEAETFDGDYKHGVFGRGNENYILEAQALHNKDGRNWMPAYEVTVTVVVTRDDTQKPIIYTRTYLPEYKEMLVRNMPKITEEYKKSHMPKFYAEEIYNQQMDHLRDIWNWSHRTLVADAYSSTPLHSEWLKYYSTPGGTHSYEIGNAWISHKESIPTLFDNDLSNRYVNAESNIYEGSDYQTTTILQNNAAWSGKPCYRIEFHSQFPISPRSYSLISANDAGKYPQCNPQVWTLYGRKKVTDCWTQLAQSNYTGQPQDMFPKGNSMSTRELPFRFNGNKCENMQYFLLEIHDVVGGELVRLGEIRFNYDD